MTARSAEQIAGPARQEVEGKQDFDSLSFGSSSEEGHGMIWQWEETYKAAILEKDPAKLPERLIAAEKAIVQRIRELPENQEELPEGRALREALDHLYGLRPHEHHPPGELADEGDPGAVRRNRIRVGACLAAGLLLVAATGRIVARKIAQNEAQRVRVLHEAEAGFRSSADIIAERLDNPPTDARTMDNTPGTTPAANAPVKAHVPEQNPKSAPAPNGPDAQAKAEGDDPKQNETIAGTSDQPSSATALPASPDGDSAAIAALRGEPALPNPTEPSAGSDASQVSVQDSAAAPIVNTATEPAAPKQSAPPHAENVQETVPPRGSVSVSSSTYPSIRVPSELKSEGSASGASLQIGELISRIDPVYPEEAARKHIEGTVKLRAIIGKDGAVQDVQVANGPALLAGSAVSAVRRWRYRPTLLGDQPVEVIQEITIEFRLVTTSAAKN